MSTIISTIIIIWLLVFFWGSLQALNNHDRYQVTREIEKRARTNCYRNHIKWREVIRHLQPPPQGPNNTPWNVN